MVSQKWESLKDESQLSNQEIEDIIHLWRDYLINDKKDMPHKKFDQILRKLLQMIDETGVVYGTVKDLEISTRTTNYILAKNFNCLTKHGLMYRRNGILVINTEAFSKTQLNTVTKDFYK